ncbi:hypothetical protein WMY93_008484 [Mugilogobius chulae]|uniref:Microtubule associated tumor suppressor candidate 2 n=1 Tax=Mugilogobius chulae TaxID=88201 RepID=A0AAW0PV27_9GOBI
MSVPTDYKSYKSNMPYPQCGDDNANDLEELEYPTSLIPPLVSQTETHEKIVIWSSEQQFEPCQEIHTFLGKTDDLYDDEDEGASLRDGKDEGPMSISSSSTASSASTGVKRNDNDSNKVEVRRSRQEHKRTASHSTEELDACVTERDGVRTGRTVERDRQKSKSETNVFASSLSAISLSGSLSSALDTGGETRITLPVYKTHLYSSGTSNTTSIQSRRGSAPMENKNSPPYHSQEKIHQYSSSQDGGLGQRRKAGFEERVLPPRRQQLVRPMCQTEMGRARSLPESSSHQVDPGQQNQDYIGNRKFTRSSLREPSDFSHLYNSSGVLRQPSNAAQRDMLPAEKPLTSASRPPPNPRPQTQLTYRKNCSSPNRVATPPQSPLRAQQESPRRQASMFIIPRNVPGVARHPPGSNTAVTTQGYSNSSLRAPVKTSISTTGTAKPAPNTRQSPPKDSSPSPKHAPKPKGVRPKIITYVRKNPQFKPQVADGPYQVSSLPSRLSTYSNNQTMSKDVPKEKSDSDARGAPVLSASNLLYEKYRQEMQTSVCPQPGVNNRGARPNTVPQAHVPHGHSHTAPPKLGSKTDNFYGTPSELGRPGSFKGSSQDDPLQSRTAPQTGGGSGSLLRSSRGLRLGLGAVTRTASGPARTRSPAQRSAPVMSQPVQPISPTEKSHDTDDQVFTQIAPVPSSAEAPNAASRSLLPKASQSGLRPPGFSSTRLPAGRLAAFGFVRSSSVSSASSAQSGDSGPCDPTRTTQRLSVSEEPPLHRVTTGPPSVPEHQRGPPCRSLQPPSTPALPRRYLPAQPRSSPGVGRKEFQRSSEVTRSLPSSPKRLAVVPPKPQSPVPIDQRPSAVPQHQEEIIQREKEEAQQKERERQEEERQRNERVEVQRLQGRCEQQETQLRALRDELRRMSLGLEAFIITTQHYCLKNKTCEEHEKKLSQEIKSIQEEIASHSQRWERLHREKTTLEVAFERELQELQLQQEAELAATEHLRAEHRSEMEELRTQQQEQMEEMTVGHQAAIQELRDMHNITMATLHEEHARTMRDLRKAHEQQKILLEEDYEKLRLSLQDQVDTLTFQNQSLRDKAKRFEEALRRSTDEQIVEALAPYQHIEQDLKSLKEVVEMKNQQIHQQEKKITDLEKVAQKNVFLEEKIQVLQQQNEDLKARIELNLSLSRQLSEENANLHESVEKESTEKKRLSRNNEELLWRLQTSPLMSPSSSPLHRSFSTSPIPSSPFLSSSPVTGCESPTHCHGCPQQALYFSPCHRAATNHNYSPGPATPTHRAVTNQNLSPGPGTPTHRAVTNQNLSPGPATPTHRAVTNQNYSPGPATPTHRAAVSHCNPVPCLSSAQR